METALSSGCLPDVINRPENTTFKENLRLQLTAIKSLGECTDRFQGIISDGINRIPVLLTGHASSTLSKSTPRGSSYVGTIIEAMEYRLSIIENKRTFVIFTCRVLGRHNLIGNPTSLDMNQTTKSSRPFVPRRFFPSETAQGAPEANYRTFATQPLETNPTATDAYSTVATQGDNFLRAFQPQRGTTRPPPQSQGPPPTQRVQQWMDGNNVRGTRQLRPVEIEGKLTPLNQLDNYCARWTIMARCTAKTALRKFNNARGEGKLFSFDLLDAEDGEMRCSAFNEAAVTFFDLIEIGRIYKISKADVMEIRNLRYKAFDTNFELRINMSSNVERVPEDAAIAPIRFVLYKFKPISSVGEMEKDTVLDIIGIVVSAEAARRITKRNGDEVDLRRLVIRDQSNCSIEVTLWDDLATSVGQEIEEICRDGNIHVAAISRLRVGDFNGKSLSTQGTSRIEIDPDIPERHGLLTWSMQNNSSNNRVTALSHSGTIRLKKRSHLADIQINSLENEQRGFFCVAATITYTKTSRLCYASCPLMRNGRICMKKLTEHDGSDWMCETCGETGIEPNWRYIVDMRLQDYTDTHFVTAFSSAEQILGMPASEIRLLSEKEQQQQAAKACHTSYLFSLKVSMDSWQGDTRLKVAVLHQEPLNFVEETKMLMKQIDQYRSLPPLRMAPTVQSPQTYTGYMQQPRTPGNMRFGQHGFPM